MPQSAGPAVHVAPVDWQQPTHSAAVLQLLDLYAQHPLGDGAPLAPEVRQRLIQGLREHPTTEILVAWIDQQPAGIVVAFRGYSTFKAAPLLNLHDVFVCEPYRGQRIGQRLLQACRDRARELGCCKLTLEVRDDNFAAQRAYRSFGFQPLTRGLDAQGFWTLPLD